MSGSTFSPDGQWMWTGTEWVPAPPTSSLSSNPMENSPIMVQQTELQIAENAEEIRLQKETLQEITSFTDWTSVFISFEYRKREIWIALLILCSPIFGSLIGAAVAVNIGYRAAEDGDMRGRIIFGIALLSVIISWSIGFKKFMNLRNFNKENGKKKYSTANYGTKKSWTKKLDPMVTKYEHLVNWTHTNQNTEIKRKLMDIEIELKRLLKERRKSQVLTVVVAGVAAGAAIKGFNQATGRK